MCKWTIIWVMIGTKTPKENHKILLLDIWRSIASRSIFPQNFPLNFQKKGQYWQSEINNQSEFFKFCLRGPLGLENILSRQLIKKTTKFTFFSLT